MQAIPPALFFVVPVFSVILLYIRLSAQFPASRSLRSESCDTVSRPLVAYFAYVSFGILSMIAGSLGIAACTLERLGARYVSLDAGGRVIVALIKYGLGISVIYIFSTTIPCNVVSYIKVLLFNITLSLLLACTTLTTLLSPFVDKQSLPSVVSPVLSLLTVIFSFPLIVILLLSKATHLNSKAMRFWLTLLTAQMAAVVSSVFDLLVAQGYGLVYAYRIMGSMFLVPWIVGIMVALHLLPSRHPESNRLSLRPRPSKSPSPSSTSSRSSPADTSDFLNLRDPFASPPPRSATTEKTSFSYFGAHANMFKPKKAKRDISNRILMDSRPLSPSAFSRSGIGPNDDVDFDNEAMLSQLLLRNLDSGIDFATASQQQRESTTVNSGVGVGFADLAMDNIKREKIVMTCERRGSESTTASSHNSHSCSQSPPSLPLSPHRNRFTLESTGSAATLYEPSLPATPSWKEKTFEVPPSPISPGSVFNNSGEQYPSLSPGRNISVYEPLREPQSTTDAGMRSQVPDPEQDPRVGDVGDVAKPQRPPSPNT